MPREERERSATPNGFDSFFDELDELESLLDEGPGDSDNASQDFVFAIQAAALKVKETAGFLTAADVDTEFTDDPSDDDNDDTEDDDAEN